VTLCALAVLEVRWSEITLEEWWRNEQFWVIGGTSVHLAVVFQGLLRVVVGVEISFTLTSKSAGEDEDDHGLVRNAGRPHSPLGLLPRHPTPDHGLPAVYFHLL
jgi:hypothetical protein